MRNRYVSLALAVLLTASGCASTNTAPKRHAQAPIAASDVSTAALKSAEAMEQKGQHVEAALAYIKLASSARSPAREALQLRAVSALLTANLFSQAKLILKDIRYAALNKNQQLSFAVASTRIALAERRPDEAEEWLAALEAPAQASPGLRRELMELRVRTLELSGKTMEAVSERIALNEILADDETARRENQEAILRLLSVLTEQALRQLITEPPPNELSGWLELAILNKRYPDPLRLAQRLDEWRSRYPDHPATQGFIASMVPQQQALAMNLDRIALILPLKGAFSSAAEAIRDGFLAAYYSQETGAPKASVHLYDSGQGDIESVYKQALEDGATVVVGPLNKDAVATLAKARGLEVPTLALNYVEQDEDYTKNLYQFGLLPEDEARQAADRAWLDGHSRAAVLHPQGSWGERIVKAFTERWEQLGGSVVTTQAYNPDRNDFSGPITGMLNIRDSKQRHQELAGLLKKSLHFEPHRRQDIDFVFMAAFPKHARLIPPQLSFHHAAGIPVYTTSHAFAGKADPSADRDMNGVIIGDMPWVLPDDSIHPVREHVFNVWPNAQGPMTRLYALGADAYNVLYYLNWLRANPRARLRGVTGVLHMDAMNRIHRQLVWAQFRAGKPRPFAVSPVIPTE